MLEIKPPSTVLVHTLSFPDANPCRSNPTVLLAARRLCICEGPLILQWIMILSVDGIEVKAANESMYFGSGVLPRLQLYNGSYVTRTWKLIRTILLLAATYITTRYYYTIMPKLCSSLC